MKRHPGYLTPANLFHATGLFLYPLKTSENQSFSDFLGGIERGMWYEMG